MPTIDCRDLPPSDIRSPGLLGAKPPGFRPYRRQPPAGKTPLGPVPGDCAESERWRRLGANGNVVSSLYCMNDPQSEGHMASHIGRREFLATLGSAAAAWPLAARAQAKLPTVGYLGSATAGRIGRLSGL